MGVNFFKYFGNFRGSTREYVVEHVLREAHKICIAMSVTLSIAAVQKSAEDALIGAELVQKMLWLVHFKIKRAYPHYIANPWDRYVPDRCVCMRVDEKEKKTPPLWISWYVPHCLSTHNHCMICLDFNPKNFYGMVAPYFFSLGDKQITMNDSQFTDWLSELFTVKAWIKILGKFTSFFHIFLPYKRTLKPQIDIYLFLSQWINEQFTKVSLKNDVFFVIVVVSMWLTTWIHMQSVFFSRRLYDISKGVP